MRQALPWMVSESYESDGDSKRRNEILRDEYFRSDTKQVGEEQREEETAETSSSLLKLRTRGF